MKARISQQVARAEPMGALMGVLCDYYRAPDRSTAATTLETPPVRVVKRPDEPVFDAVDGKGIDPIVMLTTFQSLLTGVPYDELPQADFGDVAVGGEDGPWITELPAQLRDALADSDDGRLREAAQRWVLTEEFGLPTSADDVLPFLGELIALARRARDSGELLYCWSCL
jgi:hypothetical protein